MAFAVVLWYLYGYSLPELKNTDKLSAIFNFFIALATILLVVFAWMAYRYAIDSYKKQAQINEITKAKTAHKIKIISHISKLINITQEVLIEEKSMLQLMSDSMNIYEQLQQDILELSKVQSNYEKALTKCVTSLNTLQVEIYLSVS